MKDNYTVALEVIADYYGTGNERKENLKKLGYSYQDVQSIVNSLVRDGMTADQAKAKLSANNSAKNPLEIDYDISVNDGIIINIICEG